MSEPHLCGLGYGSAVGFCEGGNEFSVSTKCNESISYHLVYSIILSSAIMQHLSNHSDDSLRLSDVTAFIWQMCTAVLEKPCFHIRLKTEAAVSPETSDRIYQNARHRNPDDNNLHRSIYKYIYIYLFIYVYTQQYSTIVSKYSLLFSK